MGVTQFWHITDSENGLGLVNMDKKLIKNGFLILIVHFTCPNKNWFLDIEKNQGGQVLMGNNMTCKVVE